MADVDIEFISAGFKAILESDGTKNLVEQEAQSMADRANGNNERGGSGFVASTKLGGYGGGRWVAFVSTTDKASMIAEAEDKALTRAITS